MRAPHMSRKAVTLSVAGVCLAAIAVYFARPTVVAVDTATATRGAMRQTVDADAKTRVRDRFVVAAPVSGRLRRLAVREGTLVRAGDTVAWLEPLPLDETTRRQAVARVASAEAAVSQAAALVSQARAAAEQARRNLRRRDTLLAAGAISPEVREQAALESHARDEDLTAAQSRTDAAFHEAEASRAALLALSPSRGGSIPIRSPASGSVLRIPDVSERVTSAGAPLLEIGNANALEIVADVLSTDAVQLCAGQNVDIVEWGGDRPLHGRVRSIEPSAFTKVSALGVEEQRVNVVIDFTEPVPEIGDAFRVEVRIETWTAPNVLRLPASAVIQTGDARWSVFAVENGRARRRTVQIGHRAGGMVEVLGGLEAGAQVIVFPSDEISDGVRVKRVATAAQSSG